MADVFSSRERSEIMRRVRSAGTGPERIVRSAVRGMGFAFKSCPKGLPGRPDIVIRGEKKAIFVHGCFWHGHRCEAGRLPKSNRAYWRRKQQRNARRDLRNARALRQKGWRVTALWECETRDAERLRRKLCRFLGNG